MVEGFVYVPQEHPGVMAGAAVGRRVVKDTFASPWIVVDHSLERVVVAWWPGRLYRVVAVPPANAEERAALARAAAGLRPDAGYTRVFAVDVVAELSPSILFGSAGDQVAQVLAVARGLTEPQAYQLAAVRPAAADRAYSRVWNRWLAGQPGGAAYGDEDNAGVLAISGAGPTGSPVGHGLTLVSSVVSDSARRRGAAGAVNRDEDGDERLAEPWETARRALLDAALALGAPGLVDHEDGRVLTAPWRALFT